MSAKKAKMHDEWEIVKQRQPAPEPELRVYLSLNKRGELAMNAEAFSRINSPGNVTLLYDAKRRRIGIKYPISADENFFRTRRYGRDRQMRIVSAARLLKQFGIQIDKTIICKNAETTTWGGHPMLILNLDEDPGS